MPPTPNPAEAPPEPTYRDIVHEPSFEAQRAKAGLSHKRLDEAMTGIDSALAMFPEHYPKIPGTTFSLLKTKAFPNAPALRIFFTYNDNQVHLLWIELIETGKDEEEDEEAAAAAP